jgi:hypothetical protein
MQLDQLSGTARLDAYSPDLRPFSMVNSSVDIAGLIAIF